MDLNEEQNILRMSSDTKQEAQGLKNVKTIKVSAFTTERINERLFAIEEQQDILRKHSEHMASRIFAGD